MFSAIFSLINTEEISHYQRFLSTRKAISKLLNSKLGKIMQWRLYNFKIKRNQGMLYFYEYTYHLYKIKSIQWLLECSYIYFFESHIKLFINYIEKKRNNERQKRFSTLIDI